MDPVYSPKSKKKKLFPCFRTTPAPSAGSFVSNDTHPDHHHHLFPSMPVKGSRTVLSRTLKAVLFGTSLAKKIRERKAKQRQNSDDENRRNRVSSTISSRSLNNSSDLHYRKSFGCSSNVSAPFSSSSLGGSSPSSEIIEKSFRFHSNRIKTCSGWFLILECLVSLILWGKMGAILCTSIWIVFFCLLRRVIGFRSPEYKARAAAKRSGECRRRTVSEGFLNGDHSVARNSILRVD